MPYIVLISPPQLQLGAVTGSGPEIFSLIAGAVRLPNGTIVVADKRSNELRYFDSTGSYLKTVGRQGGGPGEFRALWWLGTCGTDSVFAWDLHLDRISVFSGEGSFVRSFTLHSDAPNRPAYSFACDSTGRFLVTGWGRYRPDRPYGPYNREQTIGLTDAHGKFRSVIGTFEGDETVHSATSDVPRLGGRTLVSAIHGDRIYIGLNHGYVIAIYRRDGTLIGHLRRPWSPEKASGDAWETFLQLQIPSSWSDERRTARLRRLRTIEPPATFPAYDALLVDHMGDVWVRDFRTHRSPESWTVFHPDGPEVAHITLPEGTHLLQVGVRHVVLRAVDSLGVNYVQVYRIQRYSPTGDSSDP